MSESISDKELEKLDKRLKIWVHEVKSCLNFFHGSDSQQHKNFEKFLESFEERLLLSPRGTEKDKGGTYGELVKNSLECMKFVKDFGVEKFCLSEKTEDFIFSLKKVFLLYEIGKLGLETTPLYLEQESDWHRKNGMYFKFNDELTKMLFNHRTLFLLQKYGFELTQDEYLTILTATSTSGDDSFYSTVSNLNPLCIAFNCVRNFVMAKNNNKQLKSKNQNT